MPAHRASGARRFSATDQPPEAPRSLALGITLLRFRLLIHNYSSYEKTGYDFPVTSFTYVPDSSQNKDKIEVFYLPAYSPELNPDEYLNNDLKLAVHGNNGGVARTKDAIRKKTVSHVGHLQKTPEKVEKLFDHPSVRYAKG